MGERYKQIKIGEVDFLGNFEERVKYCLSLKQVKSVTPMKSINCMTLNLYPQYKIKKYRINPKGLADIIVIKDTQFKNKTK